MKIIGYRIFAMFFYIFRVFGRIKENKVFCVMTHDGSEESNVGMVVKRLQEENKNREVPYTFCYLKKGALRHPISFFMQKSFHLATSSYVFLDNVFLPMAYLKFSKRVQVVQLWHGTGTIKKFGQDVNTGQLGRLEKRANSTITHLITNSEHMSEQYSKAFGIPKERLYPIGLPRTDALFQKEMGEVHRRRFYEKYPELKGKKLMLYAPTFRDTQVTQPKIELDIASLLGQIEEDYVLLLRLHPFVAGAFQWEEKAQFANRVVHVSDYPDLNTLMEVSCLLITDYSSILFDYCILEKPMYFFAYDLEAFLEKGRGLYITYEKDLPGEVAYTTEQLANCLKKKQYDLEKVIAFKERNFKFMDGKAVERLMRLIMHR